jgi:ribosomal protein S18 acetylase RimI-like enzyme
MDLTFRKGLNFDFEAISELKKQVHNFHSSCRPDFYKYSESPFKRTEFENLLNNETHNVYVVESNNIIHGYAITKVIGFENNPLIVSHKRLFIDDICVDPKYRKMGIGKFIFENLETVCKSSGYSYLELNVWNFNTTAIEFYKKNGMTETIIRMEKVIEK